MQYLCELHRLLSTLLSMELSIDEKLGIMEKEYWGSRSYYHEKRADIGILKVT